MKTSGASLFTCRYVRIPTIWLALALSVAQFSNVWAATCAPQTNFPITVNGIVVSPELTSMFATCSGDPGWRGVIGRQFINMDPTRQLFIVGSAALDKIFIGIHVQNDPELTQADRVVLFFDADNNGTFESGDFALQYEVGGPTPPLNEDCDKNIPTDGGTLQAFRFDAAQAQGDRWQPATTAGITSKVAFDYTTVGDPENEVWELEIGLDIAALDPSFQFSASRAFRLGAKLFVKPSVAQATQLMVWPNGNAMPLLTTDTSPNHFSPNSDTDLSVNNAGDSAATLEPITFGNCGDVIIQSISSDAPRLDGTCCETSSFRVLQTGEFSGNNVPANLQTRFRANVIFQTTPMGPLQNLAVPNTGTARFDIIPWGAGPLTPPIQMNVGNDTLSFTAINSSQPMDFFWPQNKNPQYDSAGGNFNISGSSHACMKLTLNGFPINVNNGEAVQQNLAYIRASTVKENFLITAERTIQKTKNGYGKKGRGELQDFIVRAYWPNVARDQQCDHNPSKGQAATCEAKYRWTYIFPTAKKLGLKHIGGGFYRIRLREGEITRVPVVIVGGKMPVPGQKVMVSPQTGGQAINPPSGEPPREIRVKPGQVVAVVANGEVTLSGGKDGRRNGPDGFSIRSTQKRHHSLSSQPGASRFLLRPGFYRPEDHIGALIGSFDRFKTAFVIGSNSTFIVPENTETLSLAVNDLAGAFNDNIGPGFEVNLIISEPIRLPTSVMLAGNKDLGFPGVLQPGTNLAQLRIDVFRRLPTEDPKNALLRQTGYTNYAVFETHDRTYAGKGTKPIRK